MALPAKELGKAHEGLDEERELQITNEQLSNLESLSRAAQINSKNDRTNPYRIRFKVSDIETQTIELGPGDLEPVLEKYLDEITIVLKLTKRKELSDHEKEVVKRFLPADKVFNIGGEKGEEMGDAAEKWQEYMEIIVDNDPSLLPQN